jgi:hypothetical protein
LNIPIGGDQDNVNPLVGKKEEEDFLWGIDDIPLRRDEFPPPPPP